MADDPGSLGRDQPGVAVGQFLDHPRRTPSARKRIVGHAELVERHLPPLGVLGSLGSSAGRTPQEDVPAGRGPFSSSWRKAAVDGVGPLFQPTEQISSRCIRPCEGPPATCRFFQSSSRVNSAQAGVKRPRPDLRTCGSAPAARSSPSCRARRADQERRLLDRLAELVLLHRPGLHQAAFRHVAASGKPTNSARPRGNRTAWSRRRRRLAPPCRKRRRGGDWRRMRTSPARTADGPCRLEAGSVKTSSNWSTTTTSRASVGARVGAARANRSSACSSSVRSAISLRAWFTSGTALAGLSAKPAGREVPERIVAGPHDRDRPPLAPVDRPFLQPGHQTRLHQRRLAASRRPSTARNRTLEARATTRLEVAHQPVAQDVAAKEKGRILGAEGL